MSNAVFYRSGLARDLTPEVKALFESLLARAERIDAMSRTLPDQIRANRRRREGKPDARRRSAKKSVHSFEEDSQEAAARLPSLIAGLRSEALLVRTALQCERTALEMDRAVYIGGHPEDDALGRPLLGLRAEDIAELEAFVSE